MTPSSPKGTESGGTCASGVVRLVLVICRALSFLHDLLMSVADAFAAVAQESVVGSLP